MKMIDVLSLMAEGKIKKDTKLIVYDGSEEYSYRYSEICCTFFDEYSSRIECAFDIDEDFLNLEVELIEPIPKEYQLRLYEDDDLSYVVRSSYNSDFNYDLGSKMELCEFTTKFTQEEIDNDKFLRFVEKYGVKEEVEDNEID